MKRYLPLLAPLLLLSSGCVGYKEVSLKEVLSVEFGRLDRNGIDLTVDAVIDNPNGYRIKARDPDVDLFINGIGVGKARIDSVLTLEKWSARAYAIPVHVDVDQGQLSSLLLMSALSGSARVGAKGTLVGQAGPFRHRFPFEVEEVLELGQ